MSPSISASICETTRSMTPPESPEAPRAGASESSSSKKITHGRADLACNKTSLITQEKWDHGFNTLLLQREDERFNTFSNIS